MSRIRKCPACGEYNARNKFLFHQNFNTDSIIPFKDYYVISCVTCGMVYANVDKTHGELTSYYQELNKYEFNSNKGNIPESYLDHFVKIFNFICPHIDLRSKILDVGCSTGALLNCFKENGYSDVLGYDTSSYCSKVAWDKYKIKVNTDDITEIKSTEKYDLIILSAVLEHILDVESFLQAIKKLLAPKGLFFVSVPNMDLFFKSISLPYQQFSSEHIQYFTSATLTTCLEKNGFYVAKGKGIEIENKVTKVTDPELFSLSVRRLSKKKSPIQYDGQGICNIQNYLEGSCFLEWDLKSKLDSKLINKKNIIVWGAGVSTLRLLNTIIDVSKINYFVDSNVRYHDKYICGKKIMPPENIERYSRDPILVLSPAYKEEIIEQIKSLGLTNEVITV
jgi:2-polyprenyl-3-methyl-5-hydroxy-6-metoxy-1,4-benzoquinol methylase/predicted nucleic-acid-binding Zn-ribbon protein